jgi:hypothetical protein
MENHGEIRSKGVSIFLIAGGLIVFVAGLSLMMAGSYRVAFQMSGSAFFCLAFAASPKIVLRNIKDKSKVQYSALSKLLFAFGSLCIITSLVIAYYQNAK